MTITDYLFFTLIQKNIQTFRFLSFVDSEYIGETYFLLDQYHITQ